MKLTPHSDAENNSWFQRFLRRFEIDTEVKEKVDKIIRPSQNNSELDDLFGYYVWIILSDGTRYDSTLVIEKLKKYNTRKEIKKHFHALIEKWHYALFSFFYWAVEEQIPQEDIVNAIYSQLIELIKTLEESIQTSE